MSLRDKVEAIQSPFYGLPRSQILSRNDWSFMSFNVHTVRKDFPMLQQRVRGKPLVYLDSAASALKPQCMIDAMSNFYAKEYSSVHRGLHHFSEKATVAFEAARERIKLWLGANKDYDVIFTKGTTESINLVAHSYGQHVLKPNDEVLITLMEHHSNLVPWQIACQKTQSTLNAVRFLQDGLLDLKDFEQKLLTKPKIVAFTHVSNVLGTQNPIQKMVQMAQEAGAKVLIDGAQAVAHARIDMQQINCDFYAFSSHKVFGPTGLGILIAKKELLEQMQVYQGGGSMVARVSLEHTDYASIPQKFEAGTPPIAEVLAFTESINYLNQFDAHEVQKYEHDLILYAKKELQKVPGLQLIGNNDSQVACLSFAFAHVHPHDVASVLNSDAIAVRAGHMCAQPLVEHFDLPAITRVSLAFYNTKEEIDILCKALSSVSHFFAGIKYA